jgi:hypothetical protein
MRCKTCKWWKPAVVVGTYCECPKIREDWGGECGDDELVYDYSEGGGFQTGPNFGCVHHEEA